MRTVAILANVVLLVLIVKLMLGKDYQMDSSEAPLMLTVLAAPILSIIGLLLRGAPNKDWLARYCERKALEERQKLDRLGPRQAQQAKCSEPGDDAPVGTRKPVAPGR